MLFCRLMLFVAVVVFLIIFLKNYFRNTIRVSNSFGPDQARQHVGPGLGTNCLQRLSADDTSRQRWCEIQYGEKEVIRACTQQSNRSIENRLNLPTIMTRNYYTQCKVFLVVDVTFLSTMFQPYHDPGGGGGGGGCSDIFKHMLGPFGRFKILKFNNFWGFQENEYFWG